MDETSRPKEFAAINVKHAVANMRETAAAMSELRDMVAQRSTKADGEEMEGLTVVVGEPIGMLLILPP